MEVPSPNVEHDAAVMPTDRRKSMATTEDGEQGDTCRICRGEGTLEQPLFYPCKCSGSIKFVHQECLMEWLSHSQKKYCELCKTPFKFTKMYDQSMPATLPLPLFLRQVGIHIFKTIARWLRYVFVTFVWICWLPWSIRQIWRGLFWLADGSWVTAQELKRAAASSLSSATNDTATIFNQSRNHFAHLDASQSGPPSYFDPIGQIFNLFTGAPLLKGLLRLLSPKIPDPQMSYRTLNTTGHESISAVRAVRQPSLLSGVESLGSLTKYQLVNNGLIDILEGQLVCLSIIAAFILVFLIREWVINQQPIVNMPNPDRANAQPVPVPAENDGQQARRRRHRRFRRPAENEGQVDNQRPDGNQRPIAIPRPRRAVTDENITSAQSTNGAIQRPVFPARSSSLVPAASNTDSVFATTTDESLPWVPPNPPELEDLEAPPVQRGMFELEDLEAPPLQRGIFDDMADIRRNIEERSSPTMQESSSSIIPYVQPSTENSDGDTSTPISTPHTDQSEADQVARTDFVFGQQHTAMRESSSTNNPFTFTSPFVAESHPGTNIATHESSLAENVSIEHNNSAARDTEESSLFVGPNGSITDHETEALLQEDSDGPDSDQEIDRRRESNSPAADPGTQPPTIVDRVAHWLWHAPEVPPEQDLPQVDENEAAHRRAENLFRAANVEPAAADNVPEAEPEAAPGPAPAPAPAREPNIQFGIDLNDPNAIEDAEDLEGILELIGMEGPLAGMIQNIIFSVFLITLTLSASVWCPYIWGKIAILIMSNPLGVFVKAPLFFISKCGNILVDMLLFVSGLVGYGLSNATKVIKLIAMPIVPSVADLIQVSSVEDRAVNVTRNSGWRLEKALSGTFFSLRPDLPTFSMQSHHALQVFTKAFSEASSAISNDLTGTFQNATATWHSQGIVGLPGFVFEEIKSFPDASISAARQVVKWWHGVSDNLQMPPLSEIPELELSLLKWTTQDKIIAVLVGYAFFAVIGFAYLKIAHFMLGLSRDEKVEGMLADSLRQAGGVLKVIVIIGIEMIVFPLYCGLLLDCALLPLFRGATLASRWDFVVTAPLTCLFIHWFVGTCYMFHFALFVSMCRKIMRKGVLYFIRDPDDPTFHPVRDVLERPVATQLGKIAFSAFVYGVLILACLGSVVWTVSNVGDILPIQWATSEPRLAFPVDIVFYNFMLPFILRKAEPSKKISVMYEWWFRQCARNLRLSHFLFQEEREDERLATQAFWQSSKPSNENPPKEASQDTQDSQETISRYDGKYVRAPAADSVRIPKGTKVFVEVNEYNERIDGEPDRETGLHGKGDDRFTKIYVPPNFRARVSVLVFLVWLFAATTGAAFTIVPLLVGRQLVRVASASGQAPNDLYAFTAGVHICGIAAYIAFFVVDQKERLRSRALELATNTKEALPYLYETTKYFSGLVYLAVVVFVVLPLAISLLTELYIHMPIYTYLATTMPSTVSKATASESSASTSPINPTIFVLQTWTLGLLYLRLALRLAMAYSQGPNTPSSALRAIIRNGYLHPDIALASRALVLPVLTLCIVLLGAPLGLARMTILVSGTTDAKSQMQIYRHTYPSVLIVCVSVYLTFVTQRKIEGWSIKVRDEIYLVGERLHNFTEPESKNNKKGSKQQRKQKGIDGVDTTLEKGKGKAKVVDDPVINQETNPAENAPLLEQSSSSSRSGDGQLAGHRFSDTDTHTHIDTDTDTNEAIASGSLQ